MHLIQAGHRSQYQNSVIDVVNTKTIKALSIDLYNAVYVFL